MNASPEPTSADQELLKAAFAAAGKAYAPHSNFDVGAALRTRSGAVYTGANVENASYPLGVCAERTAMARAASDGVRPGEIETVAITASPCGACRQWLLEFEVERVVFDRGGETEIRSAADLLPYAFVLNA